MTNSKAVAGVDQEKSTARTDTPASGQIPRRPWTYTEAGVPASHYATRLHFRGCPAAPSVGTPTAVCNCDQKRPNPTEPLLEEAIERGLSAAYDTRASGYLGGNFEGRVRAGIVAAIKHYTGQAE